MIGIITFCAKVDRIEDITFDDGAIDTLTAYIGEDRYAVERVVIAGARHYRVLWIEPGAWPCTSHLVGTLPPTAAAIAMKKWGLVLV